MAAINQICSEKNVDPEQVIEAVKQAIATAYRKDYGNREQEIRVEFHEGQDMPTILLVKEVVEDVENENFEISLKDAQKVKPDAEEGDEISIDVTPVEYGRIAAQAAKQVILQKIGEAEKQSMFEMFKDREEELLTASVTKVEHNWITLEIEGATVSLPWREQIPGEHYYTGKRFRVYLQRVELTGKGPQLRISRTHTGLVKKLLELEIPEVRNEDVEIKAVARDAGFRSKVAVFSDQPNIDPIGACVGQKGVRIQAVMEELNGERVDMIEWSDDPVRLIINALQPAEISAVIIVNDVEGEDDRGRKIKKRAAVFVEEEQRPMAIGKKGQNIRLATDLTGFELDMYNLEELPAFKAKMSELRGEEITVHEIVHGDENEEAEIEIGKADKAEMSDAVRKALESADTEEVKEDTESKVAEVEGAEKEEEVSPSEKTSDTPETSATSETSGFVASKTGKKYYSADSAAGKKIKETNRVNFATAEEAEAAGYTA